MGSFKEYINRNNATATTTSSSSSFMDYHNKRQKEREEEEERKRAEQEAKAVSNETNIKTANNSNTSSNDFLSNHSIEDAETLVKDYNKLSPTEKAKLAKEINEESTIKKMARNNAQMDDNALYSKETIEEKNGELADIKYLEADIKYLEDKLNPNKIIKHNEAFKDGYQFGDVTKSVGSTVGDIGLNVAQGFAGVGENIADFLAAGIAEIAEATGHETYAERVRRNIASQETNIFTNALQKGKDKLDANSWSGNKSDEMFQGVGQTGSYAALKAIPGAGSALSTGAMFTSAAGGELSELYGSEDYQNGDLRKGKIWAKAIGSGAIEAAAERALGYFGSSGGIDKTVANYLSDMASTSIGKILARQGVNAVSEGVEEVISYAGNYLLDTVIDWVDKKTGGTGEALREPWNWKDLWEQAFTAMGSAAIMGGFDTAVTAKSVNGTSISDTFNKTAQKMDLNAQMEALDTQEQKLQDKLGKNISKQEINNTFNSLQDIQNQKINVQTQLETLPVVNKKNEKTNLDNVEQNNMKVLQTVDNNNLATANENTVNNQNSNSSELNEMLNNKDLPMQYYQYEKSDNVKVNTLKESAGKYFNNSEQTKNYISMLEKITTDKNVEIKFDSNLKTADGKIANGSYSNGVITINPNSTRAGEFIAIHELTHAIGTNEMVKIIDNFKDSNIEFSNEMKALLNNYSSTEINEEALADVSAQLFGTQEFINNLSQSNPNIFQKIYREIKYLWHQFRGYKNQNQFVEDLYYKWTQAYNSSNKLNTNSSFSIQTNSDGSKYVQVDTDQNIFEGIDKKDYNKIAKMYMQDYLMGETQLSENDSAIIDRKSTNKYTNPGKRQQNFDKKMQLTPELKNVLEVSQLDSTSSPSKENSKYGNWEYYKFQFELSGKKFEGIVNIGIDSDGNKHFYEINKIKEIDDISGKNLNRSSTSSINNSITSSNNDVNTTTKYSIQESENNSGSFNLSKQDNKGRTLSQEQQAYFKNSKVRDENGNLKTVYHGTDTKFTEFNYEYLGKNGTANGKGFYFADDINIAKSYSDGKNIVEAYVNIEKPLSIGKTTMSENDYIKFVEAVNNETDGVLFSDFGDGEKVEKNTKQYNEIVEQFREEYNYNGDDVDLALSVLNSANMKLEDGYRLLKKVTGYDGIIVEADYKNNGQTIPYTQYIPLTPEQIKNVDNTTPTENPDIRYSTQNNNSWHDYLEKTFPNKGTRTNLQDILVQKADSEGSYTKTTDIKQEQEKIASILEKPVKKVAEKDRTWAIFKANLIDKGIVFEELSHKTNNRELQGKWDYTLSATARGQNAIGQARYEMDANTKTEKQICKSLEDIRTEVGDKTGEFQNYMYHQLNIDRMTLEERFAGDTGLNYERKNTVKNKPVFGDSVTAEISRNIVKQYEKNNPEFKKWAQDVYDYNNANKQELVKSGVISQELSDKLSEMYPHYIPIKRVNSKGSAINVPLDTNKTGVNSPIMMAKGGNQDIQPLFETLADRTLQTYKASAKNSFGVELMNTLNSIQETQVTDVDTILEEIGDIDSNNELLQEGKNGNAPTFTVFNDGEKVTFEITKDMFDALKPVSDSSILSKTIKPLNKISNFRRGVLTEYNPLFLITNAVKDAQDVVINSQHAAKTYSKFPEAYQQIIKKGYWYNEYVRNGGEQNSYFKDGEFESDKKVSKLKTNLRLPLDKISSVNNVIEMAPRLAEYIASREKGASIETAMLDASRVTTNFKAGGDITKFVNRNGATFLNASVQGFQQQIRNIQEANVKGLKGYAVLATKCAVAGLPALILNGLVWNDDEDYAELQDYVKDNYYIVAKYGDGKFIRIPKGRMAATMQKLVGNVSEYVTGEKELNVENFAKDFWEDAQFALDNVAPNNPIDNNVISPIIQAVTNTSWYGEDIVPSRLQDKPVKEQYDETTDSFSIWLGDKLNVSPYKINYLLDQYGGGISDVVLPALTKQAENNAIEDKFTTDSVMKSKYPGEFYEKVDEVTTASNSSNATDKDILVYKYASSVSEEMGKLYKEKREIQGSNLSDKEKKAKIKEVQKQINELAKNGLKDIEEFKSNTGNTATIGDTQYYKTTNTSDGSKTWKKLSDSEIEKNQDISLKTYADYKERIAKETIKQRENGTIEETQSLKDKDKIKVLINSGYSNEEKASIYENYILDEDDKKYNIIKSSNINITQYLQYKSQDFSSDKKDDGTLNGATVSGSKKKKVWNYINNMNITYTQKVLLYGMEYSTTDSEKSIILNYINNLNLTKSEKLEALQQFKGFTVYKDGTVKY